MSYMPLVFMAIGFMIGWLAKGDFEYWKEKYHGIDRKDAE